MDVLTEVKTTEVYNRCTSYTRCGECDTSAQNPYPPVWLKLRANQFFEDPAKNPGQMWLVGSFQLIAEAKAISNPSLPVAGSLIFVCLDGLSFGNGCP